MREAVRDFPADAFQMRDRVGVLGIDLRGAGSTTIAVAIAGAILARQDAGAGPSRRSPQARGPVGSVGRTAGGTAAQEIVQQNGDRVAGAELMNVRLLPEQLIDHQQALARFQD